MSPTVELTAEEKATLERAHAKLRAHEDWLWENRYIPPSGRKLQVKKGFKLKVWLEQKGRCWYCNCHISASKGCCDHQTPMSRGGKDERNNIVLCCRTCNTRKGAKTLDEYRSYRQRKCRLPVVFAGERQ